MSNQKGGGFFNYVWSYFGEEENEKNSDIDNTPPPEQSRPKVELLWNEKYNRYIPSNVDPEQFIKEIEKSEEIKPPPESELGWGEKNEESGGQSGVLKDNLYVDAFTSKEENYNIIIDNNINSKPLPNQQRPEDAYLEGDQNTPTNLELEDENEGEKEEKFLPFFIPSNTSGGETYQVPDSSKVSINRNMPVKIMEKKK